MHWVADEADLDTVQDMRRLLAVGSFSVGFGMIALAFFLVGPVGAVFTGASLLALLLVGLLVAVTVPAVAAIRSGDPTIEGYRKSASQSEKRS